MDLFFEKLWVVREEETFSNFSNVLKSRLAIYKRCTRKKLALVAYILYILKNLEKLGALLSAEHEEYTFSG